jgi:hypothetical protein
MGVNIIDFELNQFYADMYTIKKHFLRGILC